MAVSLSRASQSGAVPTRPRTLENLGKTTWNGFFPAEVCLLTQIDEHTGELLPGYFTDAPYMRYGVSRSGDHTPGHPITGPRLPHDMAFTENWSILNDLPLF